MLLAFCLALGIAIGLWLPLGLSPWWTLGGTLLVSVLLLGLMVRRGARPFLLSSLSWRPLLQTLCLCVGVFLLGTTLCLHERRAADVAWPQDARAWTVVVASEPKATERSVSLDAWACEGDTLRQLRLYFFPDSAALSLSPGLVLRVEARIGAPREWRRGAFSLRRHLLSQGIQGTAYVPHDRWRLCHSDSTEHALALSSLSSVQRLRLRCLAWRHQLLQQWRGEAMDEADLSLLLAMTLGDRSQMKRKMQDDYSAAGASHVLALSGLHLGILACLLLLAIRQRRLLWLTCPLTILLVWTFALLVGLSSSVVRAAWMVSLMALLQTSARQTHPLNSLGMAAMAMLALEPLSLLDAGFQLSFLSVLSILLFVPLLSGWFHPAEQRYALSGRRPPLWFAALRMLSSFCFVTLAAQVGTAPLVAYYFGRLPLYFLPSSLLVIPMAYAILFVALLLVVLPWFRPWWVAALVWLAHTMNVGIGHIASWPHACIDGLHPQALTVVLLYVLVGVVGAVAYQLTIDN